ncbi:hypothetical protein GCM10022237_09000 [Nocardioides ginsengisoli]|uniref:Uncharacterized protein n=1 Tax=Nocardioides ginsengisoli TaxID=363868 RepID=A0ABW3W1Y5_9ACTN
MTVPDHIAARQEFREVTSAAQAHARTADRPEVLADARRATLASATTRLRPVTGALRVLQQYGGTVPEPLAAARDRVRDARLLAVETRVAPASALARTVIESEDMSAALKTVAKTRAADVARAEITADLHAAAVERALATFYKHSDEIADAILASPVLASAYADVVRLVGDVPASALAEPRADDLDLVARVFLLRRAATPFQTLRVALTTSALLPETDLPGAEHLLYADPADADPEAVRRALKGVRPGVPDVNVWTVSATSLPAGRPLAAQGVPAAILHSTPGVVFRRCLTVEDFEARARRALGGTVTPSGPSFVEDEAARAGLVL